VDGGGRLKHLLTELRIDERSKFSGSTPSHAADGDAIVVMATQHAESSIYSEDERTSVWPSASVTLLLQLTTQITLLSYHCK